MKSVWLRTLLTVLALAMLACEQAAKQIDVDDGTSESATPVSTSEAESAVSPSSMPVPPLFAASGRSQVTARSFEAIEGGSEFAQTGSILVTVRPKDSIPAILEPIFASRTEADQWMSDDEQVIGLEIEGDARAYPLSILSWHEIVNDVVGGKPVAVTW